MKNSVNSLALMSMIAPLAHLKAQTDVAGATDVQDGAAPAKEVAPAKDAAAGTDATAAAPADNIWTRKRLTGDWWGARTTLENHGIQLDARISEYFQNVNGGVNNNSEFGGTLDYRANVDAGKLMGAEGLLFSAHARTRWGDDVNSDAGALVLQNTGMLMPAPGSYQGSDVTGATLTQMFSLPRKRTGMAIVGMIDVIDLVTMIFPNVGYGQEGFSNVNAMVSAEPWFGAVAGLSLYGGVLASMHPKYQAFESGVAVTGTVNESTSWGSLSDSVDDGVWLAAFHRFFWEVDEKMGYFMVFAGASTRDQLSNDPHDFVLIPGQGIQSTDDKKPWDVAFYLYQDFWQSKADPGRKANFLIGTTVGPDNPQFAQYNLFGNVEVFGLMESRPHDRMGVAGWWNSLSPNFKNLVSPVEDLQNLWGFEAYYNYEITPSFHVAPDLQITQNQNKDDDTVVILGVRATLDF